MRKCYAECLGGCDKGLSNEHYMTRAVLQRLGDLHTLTNAPWLPPGNEVISLPPSALKSKILCGHHNSKLSSLDDIGLTFCNILLDVFEGNGPANDLQQAFISGPDLERWVLKVIIGALASGKLKD